MPPPTTSLPLLLLSLLSLCASPCSCAFVLPSDDYQEESEEVREEPLASCHLPTGKPALCVDLDRCRQLTGTIGNLQKPLPGDVALLIRDSYFCQTSDDGGGGGGIKVCCPIDGIDPPTNVESAAEQRDSCGMQEPSIPATCTAYSNCSPFLQLVANVRRPIPPELPRLMRSGWMCGLEASGSGVRLPKICCPTAALIDRNRDHPNRRLLPALEDDTCGHSSVFLRIVNGQDAEIGQYPWLANLGYQATPQSNVTFKCGGALINDRYVITAAHCVTNLPGSFTLTTVRVGEHDLRKDPDCSRGGTDVNNTCSHKQDFSIAAADIIPHESYSRPNRFQHDIALIRLNKPAELNEYVTPICLPFEDSEEEDYILDCDPGKGGCPQTDVAGWGATTVQGRNPADVLQWLSIRVANDTACRAVYTERGAVLTPRQQMCAGGQKDKDSCVGDSGSALMRESRGIGSPWKLLGVVSFGPRRCGTEGVPGVYTRVRYYLGWILDNIKP